MNQPGQTSAPGQGMWPGGGILGDFVLKREIGRGGMGIVYEAEQTTLGRRVALKVLAAVSFHDQQLERFRREAQAAARLHHTNIVPVFGVGEAAGTHYNIMQYIEGQSLDRVLKQLQEAERADAAQAKPTAATITFAAAPRDVAAEAAIGAAANGPAAPMSTGTLEPNTALSLAVSTGALSTSTAVFWKEAARIGAQVASALAHAHEKGVLHRDIKPSNLLLDNQGAAWVTDFGLAKFVEGEDLTASGDLVGTLRYMPPERFHGQADARGDIYSLGLTLYEMLALRPAFDETGREQLIAQVSRGEPPPPSRWRSGIPRDLETVVLKAIARDPAHRYQTAAALAEDLQRVQEDRPVLARRVGPLERMRRWGRRNPLVASLTAALLLLLLATAIGSMIAAFNFRDLAEAETTAKGNAEARALELVEQAERLNKANGLLDRASQREALQDWAAAGADYDEAIKLRPDHSQAWAARGVFHLRIGLLDEGAADLEKTFSMRLPNDPQLWFYRGCLFAYQGNAAKYREHCVSMVKHFGGEADMEAARWIVFTCTLAPDALPDMSQLIPLAVTAESKPGTRFPFQQALGLRRGATVGHDSHDTRSFDRAGHIVLALLQAQGGQLAEARVKLLGDGKGSYAIMNWLKSSLETLAQQPLDGRMPDRFGARRGETLEWLAEYVLLKEASASVLKQPVEPELPLAVRARGLAMLGRWKEAEGAHRAAFKLATDLPYVHLERARLNALQKHWTEVNDDLAQALKHNPRDLPIRLAAANLLGRHERWKDALTHWDVLIADAERPPPPLKFPIPIGGEIPLAVVVAPAVAYLERGRCHLHLGDVERAAGDYAAVLKTPVDLFYPHSPAAIRRILSRYPPGKTPPNLESKLRFFRTVVAIEIVQHEELYEKVAALRKWDSGLTLQRAEFLAAHERWDEAAAHFLDRIEKERTKRKIEIGAIPAKAWDLSPIDEVFQGPLPWKPVFSRIVVRLPRPHALWAAAGLYHERKGETEAAVDAFRNALDKLPPSELRTFIGATLVRHDDLFARLVNELDDARQLWFKRGEYLGKLKSGGTGKLDMELAGPAFAEALRRADKDVELLKSLATVYRSAGDLDNAIAAFEKAHALQPGNPYIIADLGKLLISLKRWPEAAAVYDRGLEAVAKIIGGGGNATRDAIYKALVAEEELFDAARKLRPLDARLLIDRASLLPGPAGEALRQEAFALKKDGSAWLFVARQAVSKNDWDSATNAYIESLRREPKDGPTKFGGPATEIARQSNLDCLVRAAKAVPAFADRLWLERARIAFPNYVYYATLDHARNAVALLLKEYPEQPVLWMEKARIAMRGKDLKGVAEGYVAAMSLLENSPPSERHLLLYSEAIRAEETAFPAAKTDAAAGFLLKERPKDPLPLFYRATRDVSLGRTDTFDKYLEKALEIRPGDHWLLQQRARMHARLGRWKEAAAHLEEGAKEHDLTKDTAYALEYVAYLAALGRKAEARGVAAKLLAAHKTPATPADAQNTVLACALFSDGVADKKDMIFLAEEAGRQTSLLATCARALAEHRAGECDKAAERQRVYLKLRMEAKELTGLDVLSFLVAGLAEAGCGQRDAAQANLKRALGALDDVFPAGKECRLQPVGTGHLWAMCLMLRPEAEQALKRVSGLE